MNWLLIPPHSHVSKLHRQHTGRLRKRDNLLTGGGGEVSKEPNHTTARKPGSLQIIQYSLIYRILHVCTEKILPWTYCTVLYIFYSMKILHFLPYIKSICVFFSIFTVFAKLYVNFNILKLILWTLKYALIQQIWIYQTQITASFMFQHEKKA